MTVGAAHPLDSASASSRGTPKTWSMWPWEYTAVCTRSVDHRRSSSRAADANSWLPVSTRTRPSPVATALTLANDGTKAQPSATWVTSPRGANGCASSMAISPLHNRSATSRTSSGTFVVRAVDGVDLVEHQGPRHVDPEEDDEREEDGLDPERSAYLFRQPGGEGHDHDDQVEDDRRRRLELPQPAARRRDRRELEVAEDDGAARGRGREGH